MVFMVGGVYSDEQGRAWEIVDMAYRNAVMPGAAILCRRLGTVRGFALGEIEPCLQRAVLRTDEGFIAIWDETYRKTRRWSGIVHRRRSA